MSGIELVVDPVLAKVAAFGAAEPFTKIRDKIASSISLDNHYNTLVEYTKKLVAMKEDREREVQRQNHKDTTSAYKLWTNMVTEVAREVQQLKVKYDAKKLPWWCILRRSRLSEEMAERCRDIYKLLYDENSRDFLVDKPPECVLKQLNVPQINGYPTLQSAFESILGFLKNGKIKVIGVCGTKGVGKTTILRSLNNNEEVAKLFDIVIFVKVTTDDHKLQLQEKIANRLMLDIENIKEQSDDVARRIHRELENKKYLLILDEVEDVIDLELLGIPSNKNGSKVVIATRLPRVYKLNKVERVIKVMELSHDEAWKMFRETVRAISPVVDSLDIQPIAKLVCKRCSRLPLLIHKIANCFKLKESASSWWSGLEDLQPWPELQNQGLEELYSCLKFCYDDLRDKKKQKCFLYTSLYPADSKVYTSYLVECWAAQRLLGDINDTRRYQSARNCGVDILEHLVNVSLLEKGEQMMYVSMNDCTRQFALHISSRDPECSFYLQDGEEYESHPNSRAWHEARWVSMVHRKSLDLPRQDCSMVLTLLLRNNSKLTTIPPTFFENMSGLLLLDLYNTRIAKLPSSLSKLTDLRGLFLNSCEFLESLPFEIESLQLLEVLDIRDTKVTFIPLRIMCLTNLKCLRIPFITSDEHNEAQNVHVISKLHRLEELTIQVISYERWCRDAINVLQHVASLENLTNFKCFFPSVIILGNFLSRSKSWRSCKQKNSFKFVVGCQDSRQSQILECFEYKISNYLRYCHGGQKDDLTISEILPITDAFELVCHKDIKKLSNVDIKCLERIRGLLIKRCNRVSALVSGSTSGNRINGIQIENKAMLPNLEQLYLENLLSLKCVFSGPLPGGTFSKLQTLSLKNCPSLSKIFKNEAIQHFSELQKLTIEDCSKIEELITLRGDTEGEKEVLPRLEMLQLVNLSSFKIICSTHTLAWSSLEQLRIHNCPELKTLPFDTANAANLKYIKAKQEWWDELEWTNNVVHQRLQPIFVASNEYFP
ncbi:disease resistance protein At4g27190-like [Abrus precatorius]|uniref:Disease resistance protein At4g27190-like n=1 Tax=Abrus precatorius TaxID=3816 RepID=A0A8B8KQ26_ABRPR|nr:disease resistance protein At4g27190-like [Abrus precatorius]